MKLVNHRITMEAFSAFARGGGGEEAVRQILRVQRSRNILLLRAIVKAAIRQRHPEATAAREAYQSLTMIERIAPTATATVANYPLVSAWALNTLMKLRTARGEAANPRLLALVAAAAAVRGAVTIEMDLSAAMATDNRIILPSLGTVTFASYKGGGVTLRCGPAGAQVVGGDVTVPVPSDPHCSSDGWHGLPLISAECDGERIDLLLDFLLCDDGDRIIGTPKQVINSRTVDIWRSLIGDAWRILVRYHHQTAVELRAAVSVLAPLALPSTNLVSATPTKALGCIAMTRPGDALTVALTLAHELQHVKLTALARLFRLVDPNREDRFYAPWRNDPRPAIGLLHGAYAHLGVAAFWREQRHHNTGNSASQHGHIEFARWRSAVRDAVRRLVRSGILTSLGRLFTNGMLGILDEWIGERVPADAAAVAARLAEDHRKTWVAVHGDP